MSSDDEARADGSEVPPPPDVPPPQKKQNTEKTPEKDRNRGKHSTVKGRMSKHPGEFFQQGEEMWCIACQVKVSHKESCYAKNHLASKLHSKNKVKQAMVVDTPGPSAPSIPARQELKKKFLEGTKLVCLVAP